MTLKVYRVKLLLKFSDKKADLTRMTTKISHHSIVVIITVFLNFSSLSWGLNLQQILEQSPKNNVKKKEAPPENKPAPNPNPNPAEQPTPAASQPAAPVAQPTPPATQPAAPVAQPTPPATQPKSPTAQNKPDTAPKGQLNSKPTGEQSKPNPTPSPTAQNKPTPNPSPVRPPHHKEPSGQVLSGLSNEMIAATIQRHRSETQGCLEGARVSNPGLNGQIFFNFNIQPNGLVSEISTRVNTTGNYGLENCLRQHLKNWVFPKPEAPVVTTVIAWPLVDTNGSYHAGGYVPQAITPEELPPTENVNILGKSFYKGQHGNQYNRGYMKLHAVQIHQPRGFNPYNRNRQFTGVRVSIQGNRPGYLFLSSKEATYWTLTGKTHLVKGVHVHGINRSMVGGVDPSIVSHDSLEPYNDYIQERSPATSDEPGEALIQFSNETGLPLGSVQGEWEASSFTVYMGR
jgi:hypothetical protein